jgi:hypothetical protein
VVHAATSIPLLPSDIENASRLGKAGNTNGRPRILRLILKPAQKKMRNDIISNASSLRRSTDPTLKEVYINADKSRAAQKADYEARCELRRRKAAGENNLVIKDGKVITKEIRPTTAASSVN